MQTVALMNALSALTFALAPAALSKDDGKKTKLKTDLPPYDNLGLNSYDLRLDSYGEIIDLNNYEDIYDYGDLAPKNVGYFDAKLEILMDTAICLYDRGIRFSDFFTPGGMIEVGTLAPPTKEFPQPLSTAAVPVKVPQSKPSSSPAARTKGPGLLGSVTNQGLPTCLVCVCIRSSVYCDDTELENIPPLPFETAYFYARFNRINRIQANDFIGLREMQQMVGDGGNLHPSDESERAPKLKRIDLANNFISWVDEDSFRLLPSLQELILPENKLTSLPELPTGIIQLDARFNMLQSSGIRPEAFQDLKKLQFLYLAGNKLDYIPVSLPEGLRSLHLQNNNIQTMHEDTFCDSRDHSYIRQALEDIRLDGNPINLSLFPNAYFCLPRLPTGHFY